MKKALAALLLFVGLQVHAEQPSTEQLVAAGALLTVDWLQTRYIAKHPNDYHELNPIIGNHPSVGRVNVFYGAAALAGVFLLSRTSGCDRSCLNWFIAIESSNVLRNYSIGVRLQF